MARNRRASVPSMEGTSGQRAQPPAPPADGGDPWWLELALHELDRLRGPELKKKRLTVIRLVDARLAGESDASVFRQAGTVGRDTWYKKWAKDPVTISVLANIEELISPARDRAALAAMAGAAGTMQLSSPAAVARVIELMLSKDDAVALKAAFGLLDRAGMETAIKSTTAVEGEIPIITAPPGLIEKLRK